MASLLERMSIPTNSSNSGPVRSRSGNSNSRSSTPYNRPSRIPKGDIDSPWSHDLFEGDASKPKSLSARLNASPSPPKPNLNFAIAQKALRDATSVASNNSGAQLSIKGAGSASQGNVVEITGLVDGTTPEDVAAIFKRCGPISSTKAVPGRGEVTIRVTFKQASSAVAAVQKFHNQPADGKTLSVRIVGVAATTLGGRLGGPDGLGLVREEGTVDVLMETDDGSSKLRSDSILNADPRAQVLTVPPGVDPAEYNQAPSQVRGGRRGGGRGRGGRRGGRRGNGGGAMDVD